MLLKVTQTGGKLQSVTSWQFSIWISIKPPVLPFCPSFYQNIELPVARELRAPIGWLFDSDCKVKTLAEEVGTDDHFLEGHGLLQVKASLMFGKYATYLNLWVFEDVGLFWGIRFCRPLEELDKHIPIQSQTLTPFVDRTAWPAFLRGLSSSVAEVGKPSIAWSPCHLLTGAPYRCTVNAKLRDTFKYFQSLTGTPSEEQQASLQTAVPANHRTPSSTWHSNFLVANRIKQA